MIDQFLDIAKTDNETKSEIAKTISLYDSGDFTTRVKSGRIALIENKAMCKALEIAGDTIYNVITERDTYKEIIGSGNEKLVSDILEKKKKTETDSSKNQKILAELKKTVEISKGVYKK